MNEVRLIYGVGEGGYQILERSSGLSDQQTNELLKFLKSASYSRLLSINGAKACVIYPDSSGLLWFLEEAVGSHDEYNRITSKITCTGIVQETVAGRDDLMSLLPEYFYENIDAVLKSLPLSNPVVIGRHGLLEDKMKNTETKNNNLGDVAPQVESFSVSNEKPLEKNKGPYALVAILIAVFICALLALEWFYVRSLRFDSKRLNETKAHLSKHFLIEYTVDEQAFIQAKNKLREEASLDANRQWREEMRRLPGVTAEHLASPADFSRFLSPMLAQLRNQNEISGNLDAWNRLSKNEQAQARFHKFLSDNARTEWH